MISPQTNLLNLSVPGTGLPGADAAAGETLPEPAAGADFAPWVALALGVGTEQRPLPGLARAGSAEAGLAGAPTGEDAVARQPGGQLLPAAVAGLPLVTQGLAAGPTLPAALRAGALATNAKTGHDDPGTLTATLTLDVAEETLQWLQPDDSLDIDLAQIELAKQLPDIALLRRQAPQGTLTGDGLLPDQSWHAAPGEASSPTAATATRGAALPDGQPLPAPSANQAEFDRAVSQRMVWMLRNGHQDAQLKVHPEHLGSIDIQLNVDGDDARLSLTAASHVVRDALETAVPRLRELLSDAGLNLAQVDVGTGDRGQNGARASDAAAARGAAGDSAAAEEAATEATSVAMRAPVGIVDTFA